MTEDDKELDKISFRINDEKERDRLNYLIKTKKMKHNEAYDLIVEERLLAKQKQSSTEEKKDEKRETPKVAEKGVDSDSMRKMIHEEFELRDKKESTKPPPEETREKSKKTDEDKMSIKDYLAAVDVEVDKRERVRESVRSDAEKSAKERIKELEEKIEKLKPGPGTTDAEDKRYEALKTALETMKDSVAEQFRKFKSDEEGDELNKVIREETKIKMKEIVQGGGKKGFEWNDATVSSVIDGVKSIAQEFAGVMDAQARRGEAKDFALIYNQMLTTSKAAGVDFNLRDFNDMMRIAKAAQGAQQQVQKQTTYEDIMAAAEKEEKKRKKEGGE